MTNSEEKSGRLLEEKCNHKNIKYTIFNDKNQIVGKECYCGCYKGILRFIPKKEVRE